MIDHDNVYQQIQATSKGPNQDEPNFLPEESLHAKDPYLRTAERAVARVTSESQTSGTVT